MLRNPFDITRVTFLQNVTLARVIGRTKCGPRKELYFCCEGSSGGVYLVPKSALDLISADLAEAFEIADTRRFFSNARQPVQGAIKLDPISYDDGPTFGDDLVFYTSLAFAVIALAVVAGAFVDSLTGDHMGLMSFLASI